MIEEKNAEQKENETSPIWKKKCWKCLKNLSLS